MSLFVWLRQVHHRLMASCSDLPNRCPANRSAAHRSSRPSLEALEDRLAPSSLPSTVANDGSGTTVPPPSLPQALFSLSIDGATLQLNNLQNQFISNLDEFGLVPSVATDARANAAAAGINFDTVLSLSETLGRLTGQSILTVGADIAFNLPYAGPFGLLALSAGSQAVLDSVQLSPSSS